MQSETHREVRAVALWPWFAAGAIPYLLGALLIAHVIAFTSPSILDELAREIGYRNVPVLCRVFVKGVGNSYAVTLALLLSPAGAYLALVALLRRNTVGDALLFFYINLFLLLMSVVFCALVYPFLQIRL